MKVFIIILYISERIHNFSHPLFETLPLSHHYISANNKYWRLRILYVVAKRI